MKLLLFLVLSLSLSCSAEGTTFSVGAKDRVVQLIGGVDSSAIGLAHRIDILSSENTDDIVVLINSPGGYIDPGFILVDAIEQAKERGVRVKCVSGVLAASMAFIIMSHCSERWALPNTMLLFHPVSFSADRVRITEALPSLIETSEREGRVRRHLMYMMGMEAGVYDAHNMAETMWSAQGLYEATFHSGFLNIADRIEGLSNLFVYRRAGFILGSWINLIPEALHPLYLED